MNDENSFERIAAISAIVSVPVALSTWVLFALAALLRSGVTPSGRTLNQEHMPWNLTTRLTDEEVAALWLYLQKLQPNETANRQLMKSI